MTNKKQNLRNRSKIAKNIRQPKQKQFQNTHQQVFRLNKILSFFSTSWKIIVVSGVLCSILGFLFLLIPRSDVELGPSLNPNNPFKNVIYLNNSGYFPIVDIKREMTLVETKSKFENINIQNVSFSHIIADRLSPDTKLTLLTENILNVPDDIFEYYYVTIRLDFKLWPIPIPVSKTYNFKPNRNNKNEWIWIYSKP